MSDHTTLVEGQRLDQPTFHALYEAMPPGTRAELIDGVVFMPGPVDPAHGRAHVPVIVWLDYYAENTPGVQVLDNATTILGWKSETQPDAMLRILPEWGGQTRDERKVIRGAGVGGRGLQGDPVRRPGAKAGRLRTGRRSRLCRSGSGSRRSGLVRAGSGRSEPKAKTQRWNLSVGRVSGPLARPAGALKW